MQIARYWMFFLTYRKEFSIAFKLLLSSTRLHIGTLQQIQEESDFFFLSFVLLHTKSNIGQEVPNQFPFSRFFFLFNNVQSWPLIFSLLHSYGIVS